jgi:BRCA1-associated protein
MSPVELLEFLAGFREDIQLVRILKDPERSNCMALLQFHTQDRADQFFLAHNGTYFNSIELERCKIVFVKSIEFDKVELKSSTPDVSGDTGANNDSDAKHEGDSDEAKKSDDQDGTVDESEAIAASEAKLFPLPPPGMTEIPTCAVCLDRLDASASGILTTLCNHTFHCDCLFRWEGSSCPVCRYSHGDIGSACEVCQTTEHLWICLICGHVGCGRYSNEHAKQHYQETMHTYSLELATQRVWDYAGDGFVHRLIMNKQDGKFVEFPSPQTNMTGERSQLPPPTDAELEAVEHGKLEKLAQEYNFLLKRYVGCWFRERFLPTSLY